MNDHGKAGYDQIPPEMDNGEKWKKFFESRKNTEVEGRLKSGDAFKGTLKNYFQKEKLLRKVS